jgi:P pilus assembly chaperone PapD
VEELVNRLKLAAAMLAPLFACAVSPAHAQLAIDRLWVDFEPGAPNRADVVIRNESKDRYYITVNPVEITNPGADDESRTQIADPEKLGLLVSPNRLIVEPGGLRSIRVVSLNEGLKADRVYRIKVTPQVGAIDAAPVDGTNRGVSLKLLTAYDLLVTARPAKPSAGITGVRSGDTLTLHNNGNSNALLFEGRACPQGAKPKPADAKPADGKDEGAAAGAVCKDLGARRMYAGNSWAVALPAGTAHVYFKQRSSASVDPREVEFP